jgi:hypothetical protein
VAGQKFLSHPRKGRLKLEYAGFQANDDPALKLVIYTAAGLRAFTGADKRESREGSGTNGLDCRFH